MELHLVVHRSKTSQQGKDQHIAVSRRRRLEYPTKPAAGRVAAVNPRSAIWEGARSEPASVHECREGTAVVLYVNQTG